MADGRVFPEQGRVYYLESRSEIDYGTDVLHERDLFGSLKQIEIYEEAMMVPAPSRIREWRKPAFGAGTLTPVPSCPYNTKRSACYGNRTPLCPAPTTHVFSGTRAMPALEMFCSN